MKTYYLEYLALGSLTVLTGCVPKYYEVKGYKIESGALSQITDQQMDLFAKAVDTNGDRIITSDEMNGLLKKIELGQKAQSSLESIVRR